MIFHIIFETKLKNLITQPQPKPPNYFFPYEKKKK